MFFDYISNWYWCVFPPAPTPIEPGGTYASSPSPEPPPPISGEGYTPLSRVLLTIGNYKKHTLFRVFSGNLPETTDKNYTPSRENGNTHAAPSCIRVGGGGSLFLILYFYQSIVLFS